VDYVADIMDTLFEAEVSAQGWRRERGGGTHAGRACSLSPVAHLPRLTHPCTTRQKRCRPTPSYIEAVQTEVNATMRGILVDWLVEVRGHAQ
jgi:hypothetical protein